MQVVIRLLKTSGVAHIESFLYWKKNAWQGWNSAFCNLRGRCSSKMSWHGVWDENTVQKRVFRAEVIYG